MASDPDAKEMREFLYDRFDDADEFNVEGAIFWFANNYHSGRSSNLYSALSTSRFKPGAIADGPEPDSLEEDYYSSLVEEFDPPEC